MYNIKKYKKITIYILKKNNIINYGDIYMNCIHIL